MGVKQDHAAAEPACPPPRWAGKLNLMVATCFQDPLASYDVNGNDHDPTPRYDASNENKYVLLTAAEPGCAGLLGDGRPPPRCLPGPGPFPIPGAAEDALHGV